MGARKSLDFSAKRWLNFIEMRRAEIVDFLRSMREEPGGARLRFAEVEPVWEQQKGKLRFQKLLTGVTVI